MRHIFPIYLPSDPPNNPLSWARCFVFIPILQDEETEAPQKLLFPRLSKLGLEAVPKPIFITTTAKWFCITSCWDCPFKPEGPEKGHLWNYLHIIAIFSLTAAHHLAKENLLSELQFSTQKAINFFLFSHWGVSPCPLPFSLCVKEEWNYWSKNVGWHLLIYFV